MYALIEAGADVNAKNPDLSGHVLRAEIKNAGEREVRQMLGAIIGDIVGSIYEFHNIKTTEFKLFGDESKFTDDTVLTFAVAEALMQGGKAKHYVAAMKKYGRLYPNEKFFPCAGYGLNFLSWLQSNETKPYKSYGNGSAMRVSPVAWWFDNLEDVEKGAKVSAAVTHNHPEGIKGAQATAAAIFLARSGEPKDSIRDYIEGKYGYNLRRTLDEIRPIYEFDGSCQGTVPEATIAFLESTGFEDAIRKAISLGGDSDTLAAITGGIAEAAYGVPEKIKKRALSMLDETLLSLWNRWEKSVLTGISKPELERRMREVMEQCHITESAIEETMAEGYTREDATFLLLKGAGW